MKYLKTKNIYKNSTGSLELNMSTKHATSCGWYSLLKKFGNILVLNTYSYSSTTNKHKNEIWSLLDQKYIDFVTLEAPQGLQDLKSAEDLYNTRILNLVAKINAPLTREKTKENCRESIKECQAKLELIKELRKNG